MTTENTQAPRSAHDAATSASSAQPDLEAARMAKPMRSGARGQSGGLQVRSVVKSGTMRSWATLSSTCDDVAPRARTGRGQPHGRTHASTTKREEHGHAGARIASCACHDGSSRALASTMLDEA